MSTGATDLHRRACAAIRALADAWGPEPEPERLQDLERALARWRRRSGAPLHLRLVAGAFFANAHLVVLDSWTYGRAVELARAWARAGVGGLRFPDGVEAPDLDRLLRFLALRPRPGTVAGVEVEPPTADPEGTGLRGAGALVSALGAEIAALQAALAGEGPPRADRLLRLLALAAHLAREGHAPPLRAADPAAEALALSALAAHLRLPRPERLPAVAAGVLVRALGPVAPAAVPARLLRLDGLGPLAEPVVARAARVAALRARPEPDDEPAAAVAALLDLDDLLVLHPPDEAARALEARWGDAPAARAVAAWARARARLLEEPAVEVLVDEPSLEPDDEASTVTAEAPAPRSRRRRWPH